MVAGATGVASMRSCLKLPACPTKPMPASSRQDPLVARAEPIRDGGGASGITPVRSGGNIAAQQQLQPDETGVKIREKKTTLQTRRSVQKEGQDMLQAPDPGFSCSL